MHKKWSFPLQISSVNVPKSAGNWRNLQWKNSFFVQLFSSNFDSHMLLIDLSNYYNWIECLYRTSFIVFTAYWHLGEESNIAISNTVLFSLIFIDFQYFSFIAITSAIKGTSSEKLYQMLGLESLRSRWWLRKLYLFYNIYKNKSPYW